MNSPTMNSGETGEMSNSDPCFGAETKGRKSRLKINLAN